MNSWMFHNVSSCSKGFSTFFTILCYHDRHSLVRSRRLIDLKYFKSPKKTLLKFFNPVNLYVSYEFIIYDKLFFTLNSSKYITYPTQFSNLFFIIFDQNLNTETFFLHVQFCCVNQMYLYSLICSRIANNCKC